MDMRSKPTENRGLSVIIIGLICNTQPGVYVEIHFLHNSRNAREHFLLADTFYFLVHLTLDKIQLESHCKTAHTYTYLHAHFHQCPDKTKHI